jgi:hypothetical protein
MFEPTDAEMDRCLREVGFVPERPDPALAWEAFKAFVGRPLAGLTTITVGYECFNVDDRDDVLWLSFVRQVEDAAGMGWGCGCVFSRAVPKEMSGVSKGDWWWAEHGTLAAWIAGVEASASFRACVGLGGWRWEGFDP